MSKFNIITVKEKKELELFLLSYGRDEIELIFFFDNPGAVSHTYRNPFMIRAFNGAGDITRAAEKFLFNPALNLILNLDAVQIMVE
jgi:hypothetical protein